MPPIHEGLEREAATHYLFSVHTFKCVRVLLGKDKERVVHLVHEALQVFFGEEIELVRLRVFIEMPRDADIAALVPVLIVGTVVGNDMSARIHD